MTITVEDDGPGCQENELEQLSQCSARLDETTQHSSGFGLAIVRDVAKFYGEHLQLSHSEKLGGLLAPITL